MVLKKRPLPLCLFMLHQKRAPIFYTCYTKILLAEAIEIFHCVWKFASAWKSIWHYKLFEVIWFYIVLCLHIEVVKAPPLTPIFALFWKTYDLLQNGSSAFNNAKTKCESLKEGLRDISKKTGPEMTAMFASPHIHPYEFKVVLLRHCYHHSLVSVVYCGCCLRLPWIFKQWI